MADKPDVVVCDLRRRWRHLSLLGSCGGGCGPRVWRSADSLADDWCSSNTQHLQRTAPGGSSHSRRTAAAALHLARNTAVVDGQLYQITGSYFEDDQQSDAEDYGFNIRKHKSSVDRPKSYDFSNWILKTAIGPNEQRAAPRCVLSIGNNSDKFTGVPKCLNETSNQNKELQDLERQFIRHENELFRSGDDCPNKKRVYSRRSLSDTCLDSRYSSPDMTNSSPVGTSTPKLGAAGPALSNFQHSSDINVIPSVKDQCHSYSRRSIIRRNRVSMHSICDSYHFSPKVLKMNYTTLKWSSNTERGTDLNLNQSRISPFVTIDAVPKKEAIVIPFNSAPETAADKKGPTAPPKPPRLFLPLLVPTDCSSSTDDSLNCKNVLLTRDVITTSHNDLQVDADNSRTSNHCNDIESLVTSHYYPGRPTKQHFMSSNFQSKLNIDKITLFSTYVNDRPISHPLEITNNSSNSHLISSAPLIASSGPSSLPLPHATDWKLQSCTASANIVSAADCGDKTTTKWTMPQYKLDTTPTPPSQLTSSLRRRNALQRSRNFDRIARRNMYDSNYSKLIDRNQFAGQGVLSSKCREGHLKALIGQIRRGECRNDINKHVKIITSKKNIGVCDPVAVLPNILYKPGVALIKNAEALNTICNLVPLTGQHHGPLAGQHHGPLTGQHLAPLTGQHHDSISKDVEKTNYNILNSKICFETGSNSAYKMKNASLFQHTDIRIATHQKNCNKILRRRSKASFRRMLKEVTHIEIRPKLVKTIHPVKKFDIMSSTKVKLASREKAEECREGTLNNAYDWNVSTNGTLNTFLTSTLTADSSNCVNENIAIDNKIIASNKCSPLVIVPDQPLTDIVTKETLRNENFFISTIRNENYLSCISDTENNNKKPYLFYQHRILNEKSSTKDSATKILKTNVNYNKVLVARKLHQMETIGYPMPNKFLIRNQCQDDQTSSCKNVASGFRSSLMSNVITGDDLSLSTHSLTHAVTNHPCASQPTDDECIIKFRPSVTAAAPLGTTSESTQSSNSTDSIQLNHNRIKLSTGQVREQIFQFENSLVSHDIIKTNCSSRPSTVLVSVCSNYRGNIATHYPELLSNNAKTIITSSKLDASIPSRESSCIINSTAVQVAASKYCSSLSTFDDCER